MEISLWGPSLWQPPCIRVPTLSEQVGLWWLWDERLCWAARCRVNAVQAPVLQRTKTESRGERVWVKGLTSCLAWQGVLQAVSHTSPMEWGSQDFAPVPHSTCARGKVVISVGAPEACGGPWLGTPGHAQRCLGLEVPAIPQTRSRTYFWKQVLATPSLFYFSGSDMTRAMSLCVHSSGTVHWSCQGWNKPPGPGFTSPYKQLWAFLESSMKAAILLTR